MNLAPPIVKAAESLAVAIEQAVAGFPQKHRYLHGTVVRTRAMDVWESAVRAWRKRGEPALVEALSEKVDGLKIALQLGKQLKAFRSFGEFEAIYRLAADVGRQVGGWKKQVKKQHPEAQLHAPSESLHRLSAHAAQPSGAQG